MGTPVVVYPPGPGGRRVTVRGEDVGRATSETDLAEFLRRVGLDDPDTADVGLVEWRGGGPDVWA